MRAFLQGFWRIKWILPAEFLGHFLGSSKILRSTCSMQDVNVVVTAACWTVVLGQRLARGAGPAFVCYTERRARGRGAFGFLHRGFNLRPFIQTTLVVYPGLSLSRRCSSGSRVFTPDLEKATFRQGQDLELEQGEKNVFWLIHSNFCFLSKSSNNIFFRKLFYVSYRPAYSPTRIEFNGHVFETVMQNPSCDICGTPIPNRGESQL